MAYTYVCTVMILETDVSEFVEIETFHGEWVTYMYAHTPHTHG